VDFGIRMLLTTATGISTTPDFVHSVVADCLAFNGMFDFALLVIVVFLFSSASLFRLSSVAAAAVRPTM